MLEFMVGLVIGLYSGIALGQWWKRSDKPIFLRAVTQYAIPGVSMAANDHYEQWRIWTLHFATLSDSIAREHKRQTNQLASVGNLKRATGQSARHFQPYLDVLEQGRVIIVIDKVGTYWNVDRRARREAIAALPFSGESRPPRFDFTRDSGIGGIAG